MCIGPFKQAQKYAQAFLNVLAPVPSSDLLEGFEKLNLFFSQNKLLWIQLSVAVMPQQKKQEVFDILVERFGLGNVGSKLISVLLLHKKITILRNVIRQIVSEGRKRRNEFVAQVATSHVLSEHDQEQLVQAFNQKLGGKIIPTFIVDSSLISGIRISGKTFLWEHSIAKRLKNCMAFIARQE